MPDIRPTPTDSEHSPTDPVVTRYDKLGRVVQTIGPAGKPPTIVFYSPEGARQSSEKESPTLPDFPVIIP